MVTKWLLLRLIWQGAGLAESSRAHNWGRFLALSKDFAEKAWLFRVGLMTLAALRLWDALKGNLNMVSAARP